MRIAMVVIPVITLCLPATRLLSNPAENAATTWLMAMIINALLGKLDIQADTSSLLVKSIVNGHGYNPSRIICAMTTINPAATNAVNIPNTCFTYYSVWDFRATKLRVIILN